MSSKMTLSLALVMIISVVSSNNHADQIANKDISRTPAEQTTPASIVITSDLDTDKNMQISVTNQTGNRIHFFCSIEREINGKWWEIVGDISNERSKSIKIQVVNPHKGMKFIWFRKAYVDYFTSSESEGLFRIKITLTTDKGAHFGQVVYSDPIEIKKR